MKNTLAVVLVLSVFGAVCSSHLRAQSRGGQRTQVVMPAVHPDLNSTLVDLDRISQATQSDISAMHVEKWKSGWKTGFMRDSSQTQQAQQAAGSLQRNLVSAMPGLIHDVQASRGNISTTFKLYDDLSLVCETLDALINASEAAGHRNDAAPLADDYSALTRIRRSLAAYIQQASAAAETRGRAPSASFAAPAVPATSAAQPAPRTTPPSTPTQAVTDQGVKKIIVDDTIPEKKSPPANQAAPASKKKPPVTLTNLE